MKTRAISTIYTALKLNELANDIIEVFDDCSQAAIDEERKALVTELYRAVLGFYHAQFLFPKQCREDVIQTILNHNARGIKRTQAEELANYMVEL